MLRTPTVVSTHEAAFTTAMFGACAVTTAAIAIGFGILRVYEYTHGQLP
ncbi:MAG: hypothetical protein ACXVZR_15475 [Terriglobales bacterium]